MEMPSRLELMYKAPPMPDWWLYKHFEGMQTQDSTPTEELMQLQVMWQFSWADEVCRQLEDVKPTKGDRWEVM